MQFGTDIALQDTATHFALALKAAKAGTWQWDKTVNRAIWSEENFRLLGYDPKTCEASYENWFRAIHPDDQSWVNQQLTRVLAENRDLHLEYRVLLPDGSVRWIADLGEITYDAVGNQTGMIGIQLDITERKQAEIALQHLNQELEARVEQRTAALQQSEAQFRQLTDAIQEVFWLLDPIQQQVLYVSPAYEQIWGRSLDTLNPFGWNWTQPIHPEDRDRVIALMSGNSLDKQETEYRIIRPNGTVRWLRGRAFPVRDPEGQVYRIAGITEGVLIDNAVMAADIFKQLKDRQIQICLDDFGTGYSSLSYLHQFPSDSLKIDRSFITPLGTDPEKSEIVSAIVNLAHHLGLSVIAEGLETEQQLSYLQSIQCSSGQGYYFSPPLEPRAASELLRQRTSSQLAPIEGQLSPSIIRY